jgi:hypothetical protein
VIYQKTNDGETVSLRAGNALRASDAAAGQRAGILAGILETRKADDARKLWVVGFSTVQNDKYLDAMEYVTPWPCEVAQSYERAANLKRWQQQCSSLGRKLRPRQARKSARKYVEIPPMLAAVRADIETRVSVIGAESVCADDEAWQRAATEYGPMMAIIAKSLSPGFTSAAVRRRQEICRAKPDMRLIAESQQAGTSKRKTGK